MSKKPPVVRDVSPERDAQIRKAIAADPDTWESPNAQPKRVGRPRGQTKTSTTIRIDNDLLDALKGDNPKGWQTRLNEALRKGMDMA